MNLALKHRKQRSTSSSVALRDHPPRRCYAGDPRAANYGPRGLGITNTLRTWLSMWSLADSHCIGAPHLARITLPSLVVPERQSVAVQAFGQLAGGLVAPIPLFG